MSFNQKVQIHAGASRTANVEGVAVVWLSSRREFSLSLPLLCFLFSQKTRPRNSVCKPDPCRSPSSVFDAGRQATMSKLGVQTELPRSCLHRKYLRPADNRRSIYGRYSRARARAHVCAMQILGRTLTHLMNQLLKSKTNQPGKSGRGAKRRVIRNCLKDCTRNRYRREQHVLLRPAPRQSRSLLF